MGLPAIAEVSRALCIIPPDWRNSEPGDQAVALCRCAGERGRCRRIRAAADSVRSTRDGEAPGISRPYTGDTGKTLTMLKPHPTTCGYGNVCYPTARSFPYGKWQPGTYSVAHSAFLNRATADLGDLFRLQSPGYPVSSNYSRDVGTPGCQRYPPNVPVDAAFGDKFAPCIERAGTWELDILNIDSISEMGKREPATGRMALTSTLPLVSRVGAGHRWRCRVGARAVPKR